MGFGAPPACNFGNLGDFVGTFIWKPEYLYLGTFAWGPLLGNLYLQTFVWEPWVEWVLELLGSAPKPLPPPRPKLPLLGKMNVLNLGSFTWNLYHEMKPSCGNLCLKTLETLGLPLLGNLYPSLGTFVFHSHHSTPNLSRLRHHFFPSVITISALFLIISSLFPKQTPQISSSFSQTFTQELCGNLRRNNGNL